MTMTTTVDSSKPRYPLYVVSYARPRQCMTAKALDDMGVDFHLIVEPEQFDEYAENWDESRLLSVPESYHEEYDTYDDLGRSKSQGPGPARNFAWDHAVENGHDWHWVMDDNISEFYRFHQNRFWMLGDGAGFRAMEDFVLHYENVAMAGPKYYFFVPRKDDNPPLVLNSRIYSCNLIRNDTPYRWAGRYNEDTDLSLRMLKDGWCTVSFRTFVQMKMRTQVVDGGNTENFYKKEGTYPKSKMLKRRHPELVTLTRRYGRWHHHVDYRPFKDNRLIPKDDPPSDLGSYDFKEIPNPEYRKRRTASTGAEK